MLFDTKIEREHIWAKHIDASISFILDNVVGPWDYHPNLEKIDRIPTVIWLPMVRTMKGHDEEEKGERFVF